MLATQPIVPVTPLAERIGHGDRWFSRSTPFIGPPFHAVVSRRRSGAFLEGDSMSNGTGDLIRERLPHMRVYARSLTRNPVTADDLVQDTIVRVLTSIEKFDGSNFAAWSNTILHNRFIDECRRVRFQGLSIEDVPVMALAQKPTQDTAVELDETLRALDELSPKNREIITLICVNELSYGRAARLLKIPVGTVRSRLSRAREELLAAVEGDRHGRRNGEASRTEHGRRRMRALLRRKCAIN